MAIINGRGRVGIRRPSALTMVLDGLKLYLDAGKTTSYSGTGTAWSDLSGNSNNAVLTNGAVYASANTGIMAFDGVNDCVVINTGGGLNSLDDLTINVWVYMSSSMAGKCSIILTKRYSSDYFTPFNIIYDDRLGQKYLLASLGAGGTSYIEINGNFDGVYNRWLNFALTVSGTSIKVYNNGVNTDTKTFIGTRQTNSYPIRLGSDYNYGTYNYPFSGAISNVEIYNKALSAAEVLQNYNALKSRFLPMTYSIVSSGLKLHLDAGNIDSYYGAGTNWTDLSGNSNNATLTNGPAYNSDKGGIISFDGTNDYGRVTYNSDFNLSNTDFTLEGWFKSTSFTASQMIISKDTNGQNFDWCLYVQNSTKLGFYTNNTFNNVTATVPAMVTNQWYNFIVTSIGNNIRIYLNGTLYAGPTLLPTTNYSQSYITVGCSGWNNPNTFMKGNISCVRIYRKGLSASEVTQNYSALLSRFYPIVADSDAQAFIVAAGLTSSTQANAINTLVTSMKTAGIWTKMKAVYPFVGGSAASHKFNLKDPRDLDAAYRLTFTAGWVHSSTGAKPNGTSDYANTFLNAFSSLTNNNYHLSHYSKTQKINENAVEIGCIENPKMISIDQYYAGVSAKAFVCGDYVTNQIVFNNTNTLGLLIGSRISQTSSKMFFNGIQNGSTLTLSNPNQLPNRNLYIGSNNSGSPYEYSSKETAFASIGDGLTDTEAANLYTAVQTYQTALGRQV